MAKIIITITDLPRDKVNVSMEFKPVAKAGEPATLAQQTAFKMLEYCRKYKDNNNVED